MQTLYTIEMANEMLEKLRALPAMDRSKRKLKKQAVVGHLAEEIGNLQKKGYTIEQVVEGLHGVGLEITTPTLKSYLQRIKKQTGKRPRKTAPVKPAAAGERAASTEASGGRQASATARKEAKDEEPRTPQSTKSEFIAKDREKL